jgi:hypothetical protein
MVNGHTYGANVGYQSEGDTFSGTGIFQARRRISDEMSKRLRLLPNAHIPTLITVTAGMWLKGAVVHSGRVHKFEDLPRYASVQGVYMNGGETSLTVKTLLADCVSTAGTFHYDSASRILYVHPPTPTSRTIFDDTYQARLTFRFSKASKNIRGVHWSGKLVAAPNLSLRIDPKFTGVGQIGGGTLSLANEDHFFDDLDEMQWDAGTVTMEIGIDYADGSAPMDEADYQTVGTWRIESTDRQGENFILGLREPKTTLENKIPRRQFSKVDYPNISDDMVGKPIPWAWGRHYGKSPIPLDKSARRFKLADHPIHSIEGIRKRSSAGSGGWQIVNFQTVNLTLAEFTLAAGDWTDEDLSVDFLGRTNADGSLMENPADIMADLLDYCGERLLDSESFNISRAWYITGVNRFSEEVVWMAPCIYLDSERTGLDVASEINSIAGSFLFVGHDGRWRFGAFRPVRESDLDPMAGTIIQQFTERDIIRDSISKKTDSAKLHSKIVVEHSRRSAEDWAQRETAEIPRNGFIHNLPPQFVETKRVGLGNATHARYWGQRFLTTEAEPMTKYTFAILWTGFFLLPGDKVKVEHSRFHLNSVLEVLECNYNFGSPPTVRIVAGDNRGWKDTFAFPVKDGDTEVRPTMVDMLLWLRPENHIYSAEGEFMFAWRDASGQEHHTTGSNADGTLRIPTFKKAGANGYDVAAFVAIEDAQNKNRWFAIPDGVGTQLMAPAQADRQGELFIIFRPDSIAPTVNQNSLFTFGGGNTAVPHSAGDIRESFGLVTPVSGISAADLVSGLNLYNVSRQSGNLTVRVNNVTAHNADPAQIIVFGNGSIGGSFGTLTWYQGIIAEAILYKRVLTTSERAAVVQYLSDKYGLGLLAVGSTDSWDPNWTDAEVAEARQNRGYVADGDSEMAHADDARSHWAGRVW